MLALLLPPLRVLLGEAVLQHRLQGHRDGHLPPHVQQCAAQRTPAPSARSGLPHWNTGVVAQRARCRSHDADWPVGGSLSRVQAGTLPSQHTGLMACYTHCRCPFALSSRELPKEPEDAAEVHGQCGAMHAAQPVWCRADEPCRTLLMQACWLLSRCQAAHSSTASAGAQSPA